jgi:hypothetical protein
MAKYYGNPKYIQQLESYYNAKNAVIITHENYKKLSCQDKVILSQQGYEMPAICCQMFPVVWNTWEYFAWNLDEHAWNTVWLQ